MELPRDTLIEVEIVQELRGEVSTAKSSSDKLNCTLSLPFNNAFKKAGHLEKKSRLEGLRVVVDEAY